MHTLRAGWRFGQGRPPDHGPHPRHLRDPRADGGNLLHPGRARASCSAAPTGRSGTAIDWPSLTPVTTSAPRAASSFASAHRGRGRASPRGSSEAASRRARSARTRLLPDLDELPRLHRQLPRRTQCIAYSDVRRGLFRVLDAVAVGKEGKRRLLQLSAALDISAVLRPADERATRDPRAIGPAFAVPWLLCRFEPDVALQGAPKSLRDDPIGSDTPA